MYWNHRLVKHKNGTMEICEVYYDMDRENVGPEGWSDATIMAEVDEEPSQMESLKQQVEWFRVALDKPAINAIGCSQACCQDALLAKQEGEETRG